MLASMWMHDKDALICDMAETYHIYDIEQFDAFTIARLACGLRGNSRIKSSLAGFTESLDTVLLALIVDGLMARSSKNRLEYSFVESLVRKKKEEKRNDVMAFDSPGDFLEARRRAVASFKEVKNAERN